MLTQQAVVFTENMNLNLLQTVPSLKARVSLHLALTLTK